MKNDLTTGTWQDNIWCPINIILFCTSDVENNLASFDTVEVLRTHWIDMPRLATVMTFCSFHPFEERKNALACIDNISTVLVTGRKLVEGIGGVLMLAIHANALPFFCSKELKVFHFQIRKNGDKLLVKGGSLHYLLEVGVVHIIAIWVWQT